MEGWSGFPVISLFFSIPLLLACPVFIYALYLWNEGRYEQEQLRRATQFTVDYADGRRQDAGIAETLRRSGKKEPAPGMATSAAIKREEMKAKLFRKRAEASREFVESAKAQAESSAYAEHMRERRK